jgi:hypothetical protein
MSTAPTASSTSHKRSPWKKVAAISLAVLFVVWAVLVAFIWRAMHRPPEDFGRVMKHMPWQVFLVVPFETMWTHARAGSLHVGDTAPDFTLSKVDKSSILRLSDLNAKKPVVVIFGSYT